MRPEQIAIRSQALLDQYLAGQRDVGQSFSDAKIGAMGLGDTLNLLVPDDMIEWIEVDPLQWSGPL